MNFTDQAIIIEKRPLKENSSIITVFTAKHGLFSGVSGVSKKNDLLLQAGNLVDFSWSARLHEHLGFCRCELVNSFSGNIILNKTKLYAINSIVCLIKSAFCEREPHNNLFPILLDFLKSFRMDFSFRKYIMLELAILAEAGYRLQLSKCVVSGNSEDLYYVSPKSGHAVSKAAGEQYKDKLLILPQFLLKDLNPTIEIMQQALTLTGYFFDRYIINNKPLAERKIFIEHILDGNI